MMENRHRNSSSVGGSGRQYSETSSSICNFSNTTPYQIHTTTAAMDSTTGGSSLAFGSGGGGYSSVGAGGAVIGSPLSAFSAVRTSSSGGGISGQGLIRGGTTTAAAGGGSNNHRGGGGRETMSLLVSPPTSRIDDTTTTSTTLANQNSSSAEATTAVSTMTTPKDDKRYQHHHHHDDEIINPNPNAKDPTPYQNRVAANKDYAVRTAKPSSSSYHHHQNHHYQQHHHSDRSQQQQQQREGYDNANNNNNNKLAAASSSSSSSTASRSIDPPAKSPFGSIITSTSSSHHHGGGGGGSGSGAYHRIRESLQRNGGGGGGYQDHQHHQQPTQHSHPITELSIIEEDENHHHHHHNVYNNLNSSSTSTVTGFTWPRTPVLREVQNSHHHHSSSGGSGSRSGNNNTGGGGGSVAFGHNLSTPGANSITGGKSFTSLTGGGGAYSTEKLLHRPSAAMRDSFQQLASQTAHQLEDIWDIVGIVPEERASQLADLVDRIASLCHEKIEQEEQLAEQFRKEIAEARFEWEECCTVLRIEEEDPVVKMKRDPSVGGGSGVGVSLQSEYEVMMGRLESIRLVREKATEDIVSSQRRIYEAYAALSGCTVEEVATSSTEMEAWADTSSNLTEEQRELFRSKAVDYEESVSSRTQAIVSLLVDCQNLIRELEIVPPGCDGKDENDSDGYVEVGQNDDDVKIMNSLKSIQRSDKDGNSGDGGGGGGKRPRSRGKSSDSYTVTSLFETPTCVGIGKDVLDRLTSRIAELNGEKRQRRKKLGEMGSAIASLWSMLRIPSEEQRAFTDNISGLGMDTLQKGERELNRLNELKAVMIGKLIREQRQTIEGLWERTNATEGEKATFDRYFYINDEDQLTDDLLAKHEEYAGSLNAKLEKMQPILDLIERRESIIEERVELEMLQRDPDRLKGRNASKQLMKEEKMMRRVQKELPKITQHLERKLKEWFDENKPSQTEGEVRDEDLGHFMYKGLPYLRTMKIQEHEWKTRKERGEQERQRKRQEERSNSSGSAFGSSYSKLPGKKSSKWNPPAASNSRPRSASNMRPASRGLRPGDMNRVNRPPAGEKSTKPGVATKSSGYGARAASAPRMRF
ncbi:hypothetical protein ACHAWC_007573 [Mediolabrus comicus]